MNRRKAEKTFRDGAIVRSEKTALGRPSRSGWTIRILIARHAAAKRLCALRWLTMMLMFAGILSSTVLAEQEAKKRLPLWVAGADGVVLASIDSETGAITQDGLASSEKIAWMARARDNLLFAAGTFENEMDPTNGAVTCFRIEKDLTLSQINRLRAEGKTTTYVSSACDGRLLLASNFRYDTYPSRGSVVAFSVDEQGFLSKCVARFEHPGQGGSSSNRQLASHPHCVVVDPLGRFAAVADLGVDAVFIYQIQCDPIQFIRKSKIIGLPGQQPRHLIWHPDGQNLYCMNEGHSTTSVIRFDRERAQGKFIQHIQRTQSKGGGGADIVIDSRGQFLYGSNRGENTMVMFKVDATSKLIQQMGHVATGGASTRCIAISGDDRWCVAANQGSDEVVVFSVDPSTGVLSQTSSRLSVRQPACVLFP